jgi:glycosyltransferase involved in cell wall biosynthesis
MKIITLSIDPKLFEEGSPVSRRFAGYGTLFDELHAVVYTKPGHAPRQLASNVRIYPTNTSWRPLYPLNAWPILRSIFRTGGEFTVTSQEGITHLLGAIAKVVYGARLNLDVHTDFLSPYFRRESCKNFFRYLAYRASLYVADSVRVVSKRLQDEIRVRYPRLGGSITVLPIRVDATQLLEAGKETVPRQGGILSVLMLSRLEREKNVPLALEAFARVAKEVPEARLIIVGSGTLLEELKARSETLGISGLVSFEGWQDDTVRYLREADVFLQASNYEGYGMSLIEAAAAGCPVVTTDVGIAGDVLIHNESALVAPVGDGAALARELSRLLRDPGLRLSLAARGREAVKAHLMSEAAYAAAYQRLLDPGQVF